MIKTKLRAILEERLKSDCTVYQMKHLYPGYEGKIKYVIVTALSPEAFRIRYYVFFPDTEEYELLTPEQGEPIKDFDRNNEKYDKRQERRGILYSIDDEDFEEHHPEMIGQDPADDVLKKYIIRCMWEQIYKLPQTQQRRLIKYYIFGVPIKQIAEEEGVDYSSVYLTIQAAIHRLQRYFQFEKF